MNRLAIFIIDGAADLNTQKHPRTPLEVARMETVDKLLQNAVVGLTNNTPEDFPPGSDVAIMNILGYAPALYYSGRGAIEAAAQGIPLREGDFVTRCNLVFVSDFPDGKMIDYSAGHIKTDLARKIVEALSEYLSERTSGKVSLYPGVSYRHILVVHNFRGDVEFVPPHDITGKSIKPHLPEGKGASVFLDAMKLAREFLKKRFPEIYSGESQDGKANLIWCWGGGIPKPLPSFEETFGRKLAVITAVDLVKGLARLAGGEVIEVPGATGFIDTNFEGKATAAAKALEEFDVVVVHYEAPDEMGHLGDYEGKVKSLELFDERLLRNFMREVEERNLLNFLKVLLLPDHPTPVEVKTHTRSSVPFMLWKNGVNFSKTAKNEFAFTERGAKNSGIEFREGHLLLPFVI